MVRGKAEGLQRVSFFSGLFPLWFLEQQTKRRVGFVGIKFKTSGMVFCLVFFFFVSVSFLWGAEGGRFEIYFLSALVNMKDLLIPYQL